MQGDAVRRPYESLFFVGARHCLALLPRAVLAMQGDAVRRPYESLFFVGARHCLALLPRAVLGMQGDAVRRPYEGSVLRPRASPAGNATALLAVTASRKKNASSARLSGSAM